VPRDPIDPGTCNGEVLCDSLAPLCGPGMTPGIKDGCWTGFCIPLDQCEPSACNQINSEALCVARQDCTGYYRGINCSCEGNMCSCSDWLFDSCQSL
jgi:hypothetical protein